MAKLFNFCDILLIIQINNCIIICKLILSRVNSNNFFFELLRKPYMGKIGIGRNQYKSIHLPINDKYTIKNKFLY